MSEQQPHFVDDDHALVTGFLAGMFLKTGLKCNIIMDSEGNYTPFMEIMVLEPGEVQPIRATIQVMAAPPS